MGRAISSRKSMYCQTESTYRLGIPSVLSYCYVDSLYASELSTKGTITLPCWYIRLSNFEISSEFREGLRLTMISEFTFVDREHNLVPHIVWVLLDRPENIRLQAMPQITMAQM